MVNRAKKRKETTAKLGFFGGDFCSHSLYSWPEGEEVMATNSLSYSPVPLAGIYAHFGRVPSKFLLLPKFTKVGHKS